MLWCVLYIAVSSAPPAPKASPASDGIARPVSIMRPTSSESEIVNDLPHSQQPAPPPRELLTMNWSDGEDMRYCMAAIEIDDYRRCVLLVCVCGVVL